MLMLLMLVLLLMLVVLVAADGQGVVAVAAGRAAEPVQHRLHGRAEAAAAEAVVERVVRPGERSAKRRKPY